MATTTSIQSSSKLLGSRSSITSCNYRRRSGIIRATINAPRIRISPLSLPRLSKTGFMEELNIKGDYRILPSGVDIQKDHSTNSRNGSSSSVRPLTIAKLYEIMDAVADRVEMHKSIGEQRDNWNRLLLNSVNAITLTAATMCGVAAATASTGAPLAALKISSTMLYLAATGLLGVINRIQPSQLAEEQRNAARLFKQLHGQIHALLTIGNPCANDVNQAMENVLALDKAYPLPLLGSMLEKFPSHVEPAVWWPQLPQRKQPKTKAPLLSTSSVVITGSDIDAANGWSAELEEEMRQIVSVLKRKDEADYLRLGEKALEVSKILAISGPVLTFLGGVGSAFVGSSHPWPWGVILGVVGGALASVVNAVEHGGQVGMVFEMYRSNAGFFKLMEETIESNINEKDVSTRENGEVLKTKVALQLGRSLSDLKHLAQSSSATNGNAVEEFASKLF